MNFLYIYKKNILNMDDMQCHGLILKTKTAPKDHKKQVADVL